MCNALEIGFYSRCPSNVSLGLCTNGTFANYETALSPNASYIDLGSIGAMKDLGHNPSFICYSVSIMVILVLFVLRCIELAVRLVVDGRDTLKSKIKSTSIFLHLLSIFILWYSAKSSGPRGMQSFNGAFYVIMVRRSNPATTC